MSVHAFISSTGHRRIHCAQRWLENRAAAEEVLIVGATLDAANELARKVAKKKGAAFGWHRLTLPQLAFAVAAPILAARGLTPLSRIGAAALVARLVHRMNAEGRLSHYRSVATTPGFPRAIAGVIVELRLARIYILNHPEYETDTLSVEYHRDRVNDPDYPLPHHYFPGDDPSRAPPNLWRHTAYIYTNWVKRVYASTPYAIEAIPNPSKIAGALRSAGFVGS